MQYLALTSTRGAVSGPLWNPLCCYDKPSGTELSTLLPDNSATFSHLAISTVKSQLKYINFKTFLTNWLPNQFSYNLGYGVSTYQELVLTNKTCQKCFIKNVLGPVHSLGFSRTPFPCLHRFFYQSAIIGFWPPLRLELHTSGAAEVGAQGVHLPTHLEY